MNTEISKVSITLEQFIDRVCHYDEEEWADKIFFDPTDIFHVSMYFRDDERGIIYDAYFDCCKIEVKHPKDKYTIEFSNPHISRLLACFDFHDIDILYSESFQESGEYRYKVSSYKIYIDSVFLEVEVYSDYVKK